MGATVIKSGNSLTGDILPEGYARYVDRVQADGGIIADEQKTREAFTFLQKNGIYIDNVFTAVSTLWGVKLASNGQLLKMYSLGEVNGDLDAIIPNKDYLEYNETTYGFPVLSGRGVSSCRLVSRGSTKNVNSLTTCFINKIPYLANAEDYGRKTQGLLSVYCKEYEDSGKPLIGVKDGGTIVSQEYYFRAYESYPADTWGFGGSYDGGGINKRLSATQQAPYTAFRANVKHLTNSNESFLYNQTGEYAITDSSQPLSVVPDYALKAFLVQADTVNSPGYVDMTEIWMLKNISKEAAKSLNTRASIYNQ